ncbi:MAG: D-glycerate dehydrogenase [Acidobacteria bacterium]|nr:MAG: D-glycerate dehydrogenase [Acidobacteriota bacterium]
MAARVYVTRPIFDQAVERLKREAHLEINSDERVLSPSELVSHLREADGAVTLLTDIINREVLEACPGLKVVANFAVGFNNVDINAATELGVIVTNTPGVLTETTADFAWTLLMAAARRVVEADKFARAGKFKAWGPKMFLGHDVYGKTLGLVGLGRIGQAVARRASGFNMKVVFYDAEPIPDEIIQELRVTRVPLDELLRTSDFISLHVPLLAETRHLMNDRTFAMMKPTCVVVNTSRGPVVDEKALVRALKNGKIAAAGLDVFEREPEIEPELLDMDSVVIAPHIASASHETRLKMCMMATENLLAVLKGNRPPNFVNPEVWDKRR